MNHFLAIVTFRDITILYRLIFLNILYFKNVCVELGRDQLNVLISTRGAFSLKLLHRKWSLSTTYAFKQIKQTIAPISRNTGCPEIDATLMRPVMLPSWVLNVFNFTGSGTRGTWHLNPPSTGIWRLNPEAEAARSQDVALTYRGPEVRKLDFVKTQDPPNLDYSGLEMSLFEWRCAIRALLSP